MTEKCNTHLMGNFSVQHMTNKFPLQRVTLLNNENTVRKNLVPFHGPGAREHSRFVSELVSGALFLLFEISAV